MNLHVSILCRLAAALAVLTCVASHSRAGQNEEQPPTAVAAGTARADGPEPPTELGVQSLPLVEESDELTDEQKANLQRLEVITLLLFFAWGASIGSFLNVVIYRLPNGRPVLGRSACPLCKERIRMGDNIPVVGWLRLRGRCRSCDARIPIRYPAVEMLIGLVFVFLLLFELLPGGANLPVRPPNTFSGVVWIIWYTKWDLLGIYSFHCCLACILIATAYMQWDGHPVAHRLIHFAMWVGFVATLFWQHLHPVGISDPRPRLFERLQWKVPFDDPITGWQQRFGVGLGGVVDSLMGVAVGLAAGWLIARCLGQTSFPAGDSSTSHKRSFCQVFGVVGLFLGWQVTVPIGLLAVVLCLLFSVIAVICDSSRLQRQTSLFAVSTAVLILLPLWRAFSVWRWVPDHTGWPLLSGLSVWPPRLEPYGSLMVAMAVVCGLASCRRLIPTAKS